MISKIKKSIQQDLATAGQVLRDPRYETLRLFFLKDNKIVHVEAFTSRLPGIVGGLGDINGKDLAYLINSKLIDTGADAYWMMHNHPSSENIDSFNPFESEHKECVHSTSVFHLGLSKTCQLWEEYPINCRDEEGNLYSFEYNDFYDACDNIDVSDSIYQWVYDDWFDINFCCNPEIEAELNQLNEKRNYYSQQLNCLNNYTDEDFDCLELKYTISSLINMIETSKTQVNTTIQDIKAQKEKKECFRF